MIPLVPKLNLGRVWWEFFSRNSEGELVFNSMLWLLVRELNSHSNTSVMMCLFVYDTTQEDIFTAYLAQAAAQKLLPQVTV